MRGLLSDLRYGLRQLRTQPGFAAVAVFTLALGIAAVSAVFSVGNSALLRPLPGIATPERLVSFYRLQSNDSFDNMSYPDYLDYRDRNQTVSGVAAHCGASMVLRQRVAGRVVGDVVTGNYFQVLGVKPALGRLLTPADDSPAAPPAVVLSYGLWQRRFGADPSAVGSTATLNGHSFAIVGVAAKDFSGTLTGQTFDLWVPLSTVAQSIPRLSEGILSSRNAGWLEIFARLRPDASLQGAEAEMKTVAARLAAAYPVTNEGRSVALIPGVGLYPDDRAEVHRLLAVLAAAVALVLLIACTNAAGLFLVRASRRQREMALRTALGASRGRLVHQLLAEGILIALVAGMAGVFVAQWAAGWMAALRPGSVLRSLDVHVDYRVLGFTLAASVVAGMAAALAPAARSLPLDLVTPLKNGSAGGGFRRSRLQRSLVVVQVILSFVLLSGAGLLLRDLHRIATASPGYETNNLAMGSIDLVIQGYPEQRGQALYRQLIERLPRLPGVVSAALASSVPPTEWPGRVSIFQPGQVPPMELLRGREMELGLRVDINRVSPDYFRTLGIGLLAGRDFTEHDDAGAPQVVIVNRSLAEHLWPGQSAIGKRIAFPTVEGPQRPPLVEVIGVAADTKSRALTTGAVEVMYIPVLQQYNGRTFLLARTRSDPAAAIGAMEEALHSIDKDLALYLPETMGEHVAQSLWLQRMATAWVAAFSILAMVLAAVGLYGAMAQSVAQRTREVGIRMALGAAPGAVAGLVVRDGMRLALPGLLIGVPLATQLTALLGKWIPGMSGGDAVSQAAAAAILILVALAACWMPALRAARVQPSDSLKME